MYLYPRRSLEGVALASKDRAGINGLRFVGGGRKTIATNGHALITTTNKAYQNVADWSNISAYHKSTVNWLNSSENGVAPPFTVPAEAVKKAIKSLPKKKTDLQSLPISGCVAVGKIQMPEHLPANQIVLQTVNGIQTVQEESGKFPKIEGVVPQYHSAEFTEIAVSPKLIKEIATILAKDYDKITLHVHKTDSTRPVVITASDNEFASEVVLMPMRLD